MSRQADVERIGAYAWCLILAVAGGALIIGALGVSPGEEPAMMLVEQDIQSPAMAADTDGELHTVGTGSGISHVSNTE